MSNKVRIVKTVTLRKSFVRIIYSDFAPKVPIVNSSSKYSDFYSFILWSLLFNITAVILVLNSSFRLLILRLKSRNRSTFAIFAATKATKRRRALNRVHSTSTLNCSLNSKSRRTSSLLRPPKSRAISAERRVTMRIVVIRAPMRFLEVVVAVAEWVRAVLVVLEFLVLGLSMSMI